MRPMKWWIVVVVLLVAACAPSGRVVDVGAAPTQPSGESTTPSAAADEAAEPSEPAGPDEPAEPGTDTDPARDDGDVPLPGQPFDWPYTDGEVGVVGVEADDVLNVRAQPGVQAEIINRLDPLRRGFSYTGRAQRISSSIWTEISVDGELGWVNTRFARLIAGTDDVTSQLGGAGSATAPTLPELAEEVVDAYGLAEGYQITWGPDLDPNVPAEGQRRVVISDGPREGDLGEITIDVIDLFDDSVAAERLAIFANPDAGGYSLRAVERTLFCWRGGTDVCV
ncbi:MAG TPA: SH3 domain-containing protein [Euzebyales bacterium]